MPIKTGLCGLLKRVYTPGISLSWSADIPCQVSARGRSGFLQTSLKELQNIHPLPGTGVKPHPCIPDGHGCAGRALTRPRQAIFGTEGRRVGMEVWGLEPPIPLLCTGLTGQ